MDRATCAETQPPRIWRGETRSSGPPPNLLGSKPEVSGCSLGGCSPSVRLALAPIRLGSKQPKHVNQWAICVTHPEFEKNRNTDDTLGWFICRLVPNQGIHTHTHTHPFAWRQGTSQIQRNALRKPQQPTDPNPEGKAGGEKRRRCCHHGLHKRSLAMTP